MSSAPCTGRARRAICEARPVPHRKRIEIRWSDMDAFGHVNHSRFLTYLEEARDELLTDLLGDAVYRMVVRHVEIDYLRGVTQERDDGVEVEVWVAGVGRSSFTTHERVRSWADGREVARSATVMVHTDEA